PPAAVLSGPAPGLLTNHNVSVTGQVTDNFSGVATLQEAVDAGPFTNVSFDATGKFSFTTTLAVDGSADGSHTVQFQATDKAGNVSNFTDVSFTLDTTPPVPPAFDLDLVSDTVPVGDASTILPVVTLIGQTDPGVTVRLEQTEAVTT